MKFLISPVGLFVFLLLAIAHPVQGIGQGEQEPIKPDTITVNVLGITDDARFEPREVSVNPGDVIRFNVLEGLHTVTAYHPDNRRELRIPPGAASFDSGALTAGDTWFLKITQTGEYNYFCMPHERMGHVGKIISSKSITNNKTLFLTTKN